MNQLKRIILNTVSAIEGKDPSVDINGNLIEDKEKVTDPGAKFVRPYHLTYSQGHRPPPNVSFFQSEYDLYTIANAVQLDGITNRSVGIFREQILKNGFELVSRDDRAQKHIRNRLREIELLTNVKFKETIAGVAQQLVTYGNAYIIKVRKSVSKYGKPYRLFNKRVKPIVGLFLADATTMSIGLKNNRITHYQQEIKGEYRIFAREDVIHLTYNRIPGTLTGVSNIHMVLDDIRALRKLEEEIEILGFQYAIPLYLYQVGTDNHPAQQGEVDAVSTAINNMPTYGIMCVPHTHDMKAVTNNNDPVDVMKFVEHFKKRIYSGLGISPVSMGESDTSNRNTSEIADVSMQNITKSYQQIISNKIEQELLVEFLYDGKIDPHRVASELRFGEIDQEAQIKKETNILQKYQGNYITLTEARMEGDYEPKVADKDLYINRVQIPLIKAEGQIQEKVANIGAKATATRKASENNTKSKSKPTNQHGTSSGRPKIKRDYLEDIGNFTHTLGVLLFADNGNESQLNRDKYMDKVSAKIKFGIRDQLRYTINKYKGYYHLDDITIEDSVLKEATNYFVLKVQDKVNSIGTLTGEGSLTKLNYSLNSIKTMICSDDKINNLAKIIVMRNMGNSSILYNATDCSLHADWNMDLERFTMDQVPPMGYNCNCTIDRTEEDNEV